MHTRPPFAFVAALTLTALTTVGACSNQGEGQVCDASSDDCQSGQQCLPQGALGYRCCPVPPAQPTTQICSPNHPGVSDANAPPVEGGADGGGSDAGPDTSSPPDQGAPEASPDAPGESSSATDAADGSEGAATGAEASDGPTE